MDAILENIAYAIWEEGEEDSLKTDQEVDVTLWLKEGDIIRPSAKLKILKKLEPGIYTIELNRDYGLFCKKISIVNDELFNFSESVISPILDEITTFWEKAPVYKEHNLVHKRGILLEGFPGTGKSSIISLLSNEIINRGGVVFKITGPKNLGIFTEFIKYNFRIIEPETPVITIMEDIDFYENDDLLLDFLDGKTSISHHVVIATSNNPQNIPQTLLRASRLDLQVEIPLPSALIREEYFRKKKIEDEEIITRLVSETENCSLADLKEIYICIYLLGYTIDDAIAKIKNPGKKKNYMNKNIHKSSFGI